MRIRQIAVHHAPGETRAAALDGDDRPVRLFTERWNDEGRPARLGEVVRGRLRNASKKDGGSFFETEGGESVFVRGEAGLTEGAETGLLIMAEARRGKFARAVTAPDGGDGLTAFQRWLKSLPREALPEPVSSPEIVEAAFEEALRPRIGLAGGGEIELARTSALIAADIDTIGRQTRGSAAARALSVNREAVAEIARQLVLRNFGGLVVIDCIGPIHGEAGQQIRDIFLQSFKALSRRPVEALRPSRFGLLEAKMAWGERPIEDERLGEDGQPTGETELLDILRDAEREARAEGGAFFSLTLSPRARAAYMNRKSQCDRTLQEHFSGRVTISPETSGTSQVRRA